MRGKVQPDADGCRPPGITPAYAGKREGRAISCASFWDHPRVCGEKVIKSFYVRVFLGSPPRMRGKAAARRDRRGLHGITPAYAGKRARSPPPPSGRWDHPRVCGEKSMMSRVLLFMVGSPPRMRGKVKRNKRFQLADGITPAYAGKSGAFLNPAVAQGDHPRVCGEKLKFIAAVFSMWGSPPRMRGKARQPARPHVQPRITPAYAGKRLKRSHRIGHFSCILCLFHSVLHRASASGGSRAGPCAPPCLPAQNTVPV